MGKMALLECLALKAFEKIIAIARGGSELYSHVFEFVNAGDRQMIKRLWQESRMGMCKSRRGLRIHPRVWRYAV